MEAAESQMLLGEPSSNVTATIRKISTSSSSAANGAAVRLPMRQVAIVTVSMPLGAFFICIYLSIQFNFDVSTATHCGVRICIS